MTVLNQPPPKSVEEYMSREREQDVWTYPHFVRYLRALVYKLTPKPHACIQLVLDAADEILTERCPPRQLRHLATTPPRKHGRGQAAREVSNAICEVIGCWAGWDGVNDTAIKHDGARHNAARRYALGAEQAAVYVGGLTPDDLYECAVTAHSEAAIVDENRRDAAVAAMSAGHFKLAHEIATGTPGEKN